MSDPVSEVILLDQFAMAALTGICARELALKAYAGDHAKLAYHYARAMMAARAKAQEAGR